MAVKRELRSSSKKEKPEKKKAPASHAERILAATTLFLSDVLASQDTYRLVMPVLQKQDEASGKELAKCLSHLKSTSKRIRVSKRPSTIHKNRIRIWESCRKIQILVTKLDRATRHYRRSTLVSLISRLDEFSAEVLKESFAGSPDLLAGKKKEVKFSQLRDPDFVEELVGTFVQEELDTFLHKSHEEQIEYWDKKFKLGLVQCFSRKARFSELCQRRNLYVHAGGRVGKRYLETCKKGKLPEKSLKIGSNLSANDAYVAEAGDVIVELGLRIGHGVVRRRFPDDLHVADFSLLELGVGWMNEEEWRRAAIVFEFGCELPNKFTSDDEARRMFVVNRALCYQALGKADFLSSLDCMDWSSCDHRFQIVLAALNGDFEKAKSLMVLYRDARIDENGYRTWPAFRLFRRSPEFKSGFKAVFRREFSPALQR